MTIEAAAVGPAEELARRFDAAMGPSSPPYSPPTRAEIARVEQHFGILFPPLLVQLAVLSQHFNARFLCLEAHPKGGNSIISVNSYWKRRRRTRRLPANLIIVTEGYMDDAFWCLDRTDRAGGCGEFAWQFWCPDRLISPDETQVPVTRYSNFRSFIEADLEWNSGKCADNK